MQMGRHGETILRQVEELRAVPVEHRPIFYRGFLEGMRPGAMFAKAARPALAIAGVFMVSTLVSGLVAIDARAKLERNTLNGYDGAMQTLHYDTRADRRRDAVEDLRKAVGRAIEELRVGRDRFGDEHSGAALDWIIEEAGR